MHLARRETHFYKEKIDDVDNFENYPTSDYELTNL